MIHVETLRQFIEKLPPAHDNRGKTVKFNYKEKGYNDGRTDHKGYRSAGGAKFISSYIDKMEKWMWIYEGEVMI